MHTLPHNISLVLMKVTCTPLTYSIWIGGPHYVTLVTKTGLKVFFVASCIGVSGLGQCIIKIKSKSKHAAYVQVFRNTTPKRKTSRILLPKSGGSDVSMNRHSYRYNCTEMICIASGYYLRSRVFCAIQCIYNFPVKKSLIYKIYTSFASRIGLLFGIDLLCYIEIIWRCTICYSRHVSWINYWG